MRITIILTIILILGLVYAVEDKRNSIGQGFSLDAEMTILKSINFQGYLYRDSNPMDTTMDMWFGIYDRPSGGNLLFEQTRRSVTVTNGWFTVILTGIPDSVFPVSGPTRYLEVKAPVTGPALTPRISLVSVGYSYHALTADTAEYAKAALIEPHNHLGESWTTTAINRGLLMKLDCNTSSGINCLLDSALNAGSGGAYGARLYAAGTGTGARYGVGAYASCPSGSGSAATGIYASGMNAGTGVAYGGNFYAAGAGTGTRYGVNAFVAGAGRMYGIRGVASPVSAATDSGFGVYGSCSHGGSGPTFGGFFTADDYGIYANCNDGRSGYFRNNNNDYYALTAWNNTGTGATVKGLYVRGNGYATGGWSSFLADGKAGFSLTSPDMEVVTSGNGSLVNGEARIAFEQTVKEALATDARLKVIVTPTSQCNGVFVDAKSSAGFTVKELINGKSNATFDWIAIGRIKGYDKRPAIRPMTTEQMKMDQQGYLTSEDGVTKQEEEKQRIIEIRTPETESQEIPTQEIR